MAGMKGLLKSVFRTAWGITFLAFGGLALLGDVVLVHLGEGIGCTFAWLVAGLLSVGVAVLIRKCTGRPIGPIWALLAAAVDYVLIFTVLTLGGGGGKAVLLYFAALVCFYRILTWVKAEPPRPSPLPAGVRAAMNRAGYISRQNPALGQGEQSVQS
jgi:hypothetical protein